MAFDENHAGGGGGGDGESCLSKMRNSSVMDRYLRRLAATADIDLGCCPKCYAAFVVTHGLSIMHANDKDEEPDMEFIIRMLVAATSAVYDKKLIVLAVECEDN